VPPNADIEPAHGQPGPRHQCSDPLRVVAFKKTLMMMSLNDPAPLSLFNHIWCRFFDDQSSGKAAAYRPVHSEATKSTTRRKPLPQAEQFEVLVVGSGTGGKLVAWHMAQSGRRTAVVERRWIGGSCPNIACMPSKNEISSARIAYLTRNAAQFGTTAGPVAIDMTAVRKRKREMVERQVATHLEQYKASGAELIMGTGRFAGPKTLEVTLNDGGTRVLSADTVFLNLGTHAALPNVSGLDAARPLTHVEALELDHLPLHLLVIGGGYSGLEFAQAFRRFGSNVTIIESGPKILGREDLDVAQEMQRILSDEGIEIVAAAELLQVRGRSGEKVSVVVRTRSGERTIEGSDILVSAGRIPNTSGIGLKEVGIELDDRGYIRVNERLETSAPDVWAIGECAGSPQFTHISEDDFRIIRDNLAGNARSTRDRLVPYCMFTDPPLARVGLSEGEAERRGIVARIVKLPMSSVLRAQATDERQGFMKALIAENDDRILGFAMIGAEAGEVLAAVHIAMLAGLSYSRFADAAFAHPTMAEGLSPLFSQVPRRPIQQSTLKTA
jgi:pyruvate/2-oxoglutarate dehydrogenase complex dihydrolipoamide dehydrogenase (E3) component